MAERISAVEASRRYLISEKTIRKWIRQGALNAPLELINGVKTHAIDTEELELVIARRNTTGIVPEHHYPCSERIQALELRVAALERAMMALEHPSFAKGPTPRNAEQKGPTPSTGARSDLPSGLTPFTSFYRAHGIAETSARRAIGVHFQVVVGSWAGGIRQCLDEQGRRDFVAYFASAGKLQQCDTPDCPCKE